MRHYICYVKWLYIKLVRIFAQAKVALRASVDVLTAQLAAGALEREELVKVTYLKREHTTKLAVCCLCVQ